MDRGGLYLGRILDPDGAKGDEERMELESERLTTHGVIVGMTGSGKTGLGIVLLEEVLASGVPALILDPKGDMGNLLLNFPDGSPEAFLPWIDPGEAKREGLSPEELARRTAERWDGGLEAAGVDRERRARLRSDVEMRILTPGSTSGIPLDVLGDLSAPEVSWEDEAETVREEIEGLVSGLLVLAGIEADPLTSREHILLSNLVEHAWREGRDLDLSTLLMGVQDPPMRRLGVFQVDDFFPAGERTKLALRLNGLLASPSFASWGHGEPLDVDRLLRGPTGRPRASIVYLAHLTETERQFVVTLLLSKVVTWMRSQAGTSDLRAMIYVDEVFGMAPPTAEPPSKRPMMTIFKQARAHGVGMVVSTQNPVDLDYKIMSNAGTWMVGRLQTERDKARVVEALRSASGGVDVAAWDARIGELGKRQFLLKTARSSEPTLFTTRWAMSYLRGPLTRDELTRLRDADASARPPDRGEDPAGRASSGRPAAEPPALAPDESPVAPSVAEGIRVAFADPGTPWLAEVGAGGAPHRLAPGLAFTAELLFDESHADLRHTESWEAVVFPLSDPVRVEEAQAVDHDPRDFRSEAPEGTLYVVPEVSLSRASFFDELRRDLAEHLFRERTVEIYRNRELRLYSRVGESESDFRARCLAAAEDGADEEAARLRDRYEKRLDSARDRIRKAERRVRELEVDVDSRKQQELLAGAGEVLSLFLGGRRRVRSLSGAASRRSTTRRTEERLESATEALDDRRDEVQELEEELKEEISEIWEKWKAAAEEIEPLEVGLEKTDIRVEDPLLFWAPAPD